MRWVLIWIVCLISSFPTVLGQETPRIPVSKISLPDPAYIGMPIWIQVVSPTSYKIHYPSSTVPNDFGCNEVEIMWDGRVLRPLIGLPAGPSSGAACGWLGIADTAESKLPIHLQYSLTEPGTYTVRFTRYSPFRKPALEVAEQSEWVPLHLHVTPPDMVEHWLSSELSALPGTSGRLLGEALPSLLASRDPRVLQLMIETTYHRDPAVADYAANSLELFDPAEVRSQLLLVLREHGPNDALGYLFGSRGNIVAPIASQIVASSLPYLRSSQTEKVAAAIHVLSIMHDPYFHQSPETATQIVSALQSEVDFIVAEKNEKAAWWIANFLGQTRPAVGRALLWKLINAGLATEQSLSCVTWFHDSSDLPQITAVVKQYSPSDPHGYQHSGVVSQMQTQYGRVAQPFLRDILASSRQTWVQTAAAQALVQLNDRIGWEFFIDVVRHRPFYRDEMVRWLGEVFPAVSNANDAAIITFLASRRAKATAQN